MCCALMLLQVSLVLRVAGGRLREQVLAFILLFWPQEWIVLVQHPHRDQVRDGGSGGGCFGVEIVTSGWIPPRGGVVGTALLKVPQFIAVAAWSGALL